MFDLTNKMILVVGDVQAFGITASPLDTAWCELENIKNPMERIGLQTT